EIANLRIENTKLKQIIKQNRTTIIALQPPVSPVLSVTPQKPTLSINSRDITDSVNLEQAQSDTPEKIISPEQIENTSDNASNSYIYQPIIIETKSLEDKEVDEFLDSKDKERVSNMIRERNKEKKFRGLSPVESEKTVNKIHDQNLNESSKPSINSDSTDPFEYNDDLSQPDKNQIVEQDLKQELSAFPTSRKNITSNRNLLDDENQHNQVTAQSIVCIFRKAIQSGREEILHWCRYIERYDKRVNEIISDGKVKIKTAKSLVYKEVKQLLPDTTDANLRQKTLRARKIYNLFNAIGIEKIEQVTYSANAISNLTNTQIQNIINHVLSAELARPKTVNKIHDRNNSEVTRSDKVLTPEYLDWYSKLTDLPATISDKLHSKLYTRYKKKTGLDPWINSEVSESPQIDNADNHLSQDCVIKISKFPEEKDVIIEAVQKRFPFLRYIKSNAWYRDVFKYTNSEAKCPICKEVHTRLGIWGDWSCLGKNDHYFLNCPFRIDQKKIIIATQSLPETQVRVPNKISNSSTRPNKTRLYQYAIEHEIDPEKFSIITEAEKKRWDRECFHEDLERDIRFYRGGIERKEDSRKYRKFLTDRERLVGEELLRRGILKSGLRTTWLDDLMKEWEEIYTQFDRT
ncbi:5490_t:CDS:2, partial [Diversispora eburnea]